MASPTLLNVSTATARDLRAAYAEHGYVVVEGVLPPPSSPEYAQLQAAAEAAVQATRAGSWPHRRIVGKRFPPFDATNPDSWGVQHLMHPEAPEHEVFRRFYADPKLLAVSAALLGLDGPAGADRPVCSAEPPTREMQVELFNLLINPVSSAFALGWHRDDVRPETDPAEEQKILDSPVGGVQWNAPLYPDDCLFIVPGSHNRLRTPSEVDANHAVPPPPAPVGPDGQPSTASSEDGSPAVDKAIFDGAWSVDPPSTLRVALRPGQTAFYSQRILHRASYVPSKKRQTLHGCYGLAGSEQRARNVLQHGLDWMRDPAFGAALPERLQPMWSNLVQLEEKSEGKDLGFSLDG